MLTLLGSLLGFLSSSVPSLLKMWQQKQDNNQELAILDRQLEQQRQGHVQRLEAINVEADIKHTQALYTHDASLKGSPWIETLRASVRPFLTYAFFTVFATVKMSALYVLLVDQGIGFANAMPLIWDGETEALFAAVVSFWFGARALNNR